MKKITNIYMLRHGQTKHNENKVFQGHSDNEETHLTDDGLKEVQSLLNTIKDFNPASIYTSDLKRCVQSAEVIAQALNLNVSSSNLLRGKKMGKFEGLGYEKYRSENKKIITEFDSLPELQQWDFHLAPDVESNREVLNRLLHFFKSVHIENAGKNILVVTHGGAIRNMLFHLNWAKQQELKAGSVENCGYIKITYDGDHFRLIEVDGVNKPNNN